MTLLQILILGAVQGITEFLPVSSSGHLVVVQSLFRQLSGQVWPDMVMVNVFLHVGTLAAITVYYWRRIILLLSKDRRVLLLLAVGTIPAVVVGLTLQRLAPDILQSPLLSGFMFLLTGFLLLWGGRRDGKWDYQKLTYAQAIGIGLFQAAGILPGISRSGWTIAGAMLLGVRRESATTFSFLLAIPVIAGATVLQIWDLPGSKEHIALPLLAVGATIAFLVGLLSLWSVVRIVERGRLAWFACWLFPLGLGVIIWQLAT
jgi:undecaprenyl-diphosphatase